MISERWTSLDKPARFSYVFMVGMLVMVVTLRLGPMLVAILFTYLAVRALQVRPTWNKWAALVLFVVALSGLVYVLAHFTNLTVRALPEIANKAIPSFIQYARQQGVEPAFTDFDSLKEIALESAQSSTKYLGSFAKFARGASTEILLLIIGLVIGLSLFVRPGITLASQAKPLHPNLFSVYTAEIVARFGTFYRSFALVFGAQIIISAINTFLTAIFVFVVDLPYAVVIVGITFLCGLIPVLGNLISNTIIVGVGFTVAPKTAITALIFLVVIHKLEYFLNSQIIGHRIRNPVWLTLLALVVGERLLGIPGIVLAPVILHYIKEEASAIRVMRTDLSNPKSEAA